MLFAICGSRHEFMMTVFVLLLRYGDNVLLGTCMINVLLEAIWWYDIGYIDDVNDMQWLIMRIDDWYCL